MKILIIGRGHCGLGLSRVFERQQISYCNISHKDEWEAIALAHKPVLIVNAAGIVGDKTCEKAGDIATFNANVDFASNVLHTAEKVGARCALFSTGAVYAKPSQTPKRESDPVAASNLYVASKIEMENTCVSKSALILRLSNIIGDGRHRNDYHNRIKKWAYVADTYVSTIGIQRLARLLVRYAFLKDVNGIFNVADPGFRYLPVYAQQFHSEPLEIRQVEDMPQSASVSHILDTTRARKVGLL